MSRSTKPKTEIDEAATRAESVVPGTIPFPDVNSPGFAEAMREEGRRLAEADAKDPTIDSFMDAALLDLAEELDRLEK